MILTKAKDEIKEKTHTHTHTHSSHNTFADKARMQEKLIYNVLNFNTLYVLTNVAQCQQWSVLVRCLTWIWVHIHREELYV